MRVISIPKLSESQLFKLSDFVSNLGIVFFGALISPIFTGLDRASVVGILLCAVGTVLCAFFSIIIVRNIKL